MLRILLPLAAVFTACTPAPEDVAMRRADPIPPTDSPGSGREEPVRPIAAASHRAGPAAQAPIPDAVSAAENPVPGAPNDSPGDALGRRILSTAFVRVGPDGHLTVELHGGRMLVLRDVVMRAADYCGVQVSGDTAGKKVCGRYAMVAAARPGGAPMPIESTEAASNPVPPGRRPVGRE